MILKSVIIWLVLISLPISASFIQNSVQPYHFGKTTRLNTFVCHPENKNKAIYYCLKHKKLINRADDLGITPLMALAFNDSKLAVAAIGNSLIALGACPNKQDDLGRTALHYATIQMNHRLAMILLGAGANPYLKDNAGFSPLDELVKHHPLMHIQSHYNNSNLDSSYQDLMLLWNVFFEKLKKEKKLGSMSDLYRFIINLE